LDTSIEFLPPSDKVQDLTVWWRF